MSQPGTFLGLINLTRDHLKNKASGLAHIERKVTVRERRGGGAGRQAGRQTDRQGQTNRQTDTDRTRK